MRRPVRAVALDTVRKSLAADFMVEVPIPTLPLSSIKKRVVDDPTLTAGTPAGAFTESCAHGVVVPTPTFPPWNSAFCDESRVSAARVEVAKSPGDDVAT